MRLSSHKAASPCHHRRSWPLVRSADDVLLSLLMRDFSDVHGRSYRSHLRIRRTNQPTLLLITLKKRLGHPTRRRTCHPQRRWLRQRSSPQSHHLGATPRHKRDSRHQTHGLRDVDIPKRGRACRRAEESG